MLRLGHHQTTFVIAVEGGISKIIWQFDQIGMANGLSSIISGELVLANAGAEFYQIAAIDVG